MNRREFAQACLPVFVGPGREVEQEPVRCPFCKGPGCVTQLGVLADYTGTLRADDGRPFAILRCSRGHLFTRPDG